ncbi:MAG: thiamine pyrophosphate-dependent enzyme [Candidatus Bathyarchaeota archaeon]|nr:thiamine pyrophosphate-dependent enzyme [Candidatus Bathyarchaeota archaeon]
MVTLKDLETPKKNTWCPGCGNFGILLAFKRALVELMESSLEREQVVIVSGIGCHGKTVNYVDVNGFHGIHGRVLPLATGIKLANPELAVVGFAGDADQYDEGWDHFSHAIRRNIDITLIVHDNQVLGLTTGQTTSTSLLGFKTKSTPLGSITPPLNPIAHALVSNGTFVARGFAGNVPHLQNLIVQAIRHRGFSYIDVLQPCVTFNYLNTYQWFRERVYALEEEGHDQTDRMNALEKSIEWGDKIPIGIFYKEERPTYRDNLPHVKKKPLTKMPIEKIDITPLIESMK